MKQNTSILWGIVVVVLIALGIWYFSSSTTSTGTPDEGTTTTTPTNTTGTTKPATPGSSSTFKSIFTQSGNHQCFFEQLGPGTRSSSVVYIADGKMRGEFRTVTGDKTSADLMVYTGGTLYSWKEGMTVGKKSSITSIAQLPEVIPNDLTSGASFGVSTNNVSWDCHDWLKDAKLLTVPTYVKF